MTRRPERPYATPEALRAAVVARAKAAARAEPGLGVAERLRQFAYGRFLARVFTCDPDGWVLKGGTALLARLPVARHSLDVDLWSGRDELGDAEQALERAAALDLGDHSSFAFGQWRRSHRHGISVSQTMVTCRIGRQEFSRFGVDLAGGHHPPLPPDLVDPPRPVEVPGLPEPAWRLYPLAAQIADKLAGIGKRHGSRPSSRYRDLVDLACIAGSQSVEAAHLHLAIHDTLPRQGVAVPAAFGVPDRDVWAAGYRQSARQLSALADVGFEQGLALVKALLDPVLAGRRTGVWSPDGAAWQEG